MPPSPKVLARLRFGAPLDPRNNSLNFIRLILALMVLFAHSFHLVGAGNGPGFKGENLGGWAVAGFFGISGYLITGSRFNNRLGTYLIHRIARIIPAFLVCLVVMAAVFAPIAYSLQHGSLHGFFQTPTTPANSIFANMFLKINTYDIAGTPAGVPYPGAWNGSLWTLYFEFICYLIVAFLGTFAFVKRTPWAMVAAFLLSVAVWANIQRIDPYIQSNLDFNLLARLLPFFLGGAVVKVFSKKIGLSWQGAAVSAVLAAAAIFGCDGFGNQLAAPFLAYLLLWISTWLPSPKIVMTNDVSYGAYIYAFPVQQLLAVFGAYHWGVWIFTVVAVFATMPLAIVSWLAVEQPIMRLARRRV
ncbi:acyltransferase [Arthrobacter alpinus]|uniref:acyltransferase family protein n=1 Tax=Arthrobacter alpinus TaxID=656366 RepID=UPI0016462C65|nr:acyltransferase [Arthrobacter alpinus]